MVSVCYVPVFIALRLWVTSDALASSGLVAPVFKVSRAEGQGDAVLSGKAGDGSVVAAYLPRAASFLQNSGFPIWGASRGWKSSLTIRLTSDSSACQLLGQEPAQNQQVARLWPLDVARARACLSLGVALGTQLVAKPSLVSCGCLAQALRSMFHLLRLVTADGR